MEKWTPVSESLPAYSKRGGDFYLTVTDKRGDRFVLICTYLPLFDGDITPDWRSVSSEERCISDYDWTAIAWMPEYLPKPYKGK